MSPRRAFRPASVGLVMLVLGCGTAERKAAEARADSLQRVLQHQRDSLQGARVKATAESLASVQVASAKALAAKRRYKQPTAQIAAMKADLRTLVVVEEGVFADQRRYTTSLQPLIREAGFVGMIFPSPGIQITVTEAGADGFSARATFSESGRECVIFEGPASRYKLPPAEIEAVPVCR